MSRRTFLRHSKGRVPEASVAQRYLYSWPAELLYANTHTLPRITSRDLFGNEQPLELEIGCGSAEFLCSLATKTPDTNFLGVDISGLALFKAIESALALRLANIKFINADFRYMQPLLCPTSLQAVYLHFPDPNNKPKFNKRRLFNQTFLNHIAVALNEDGLLSVMTDIHEFFLDMLQLVEQDSRFIKAHPQRYLVGFEPDVKSHFQRVWENHGESVFRFEVLKEAPGLKGNIT
jgi:tRNA (guanine-N7-)-methyltransferase